MGTKEQENEVLKKAELKAREKLEVFDDTRKIPTDRGYAWVILLAAVAEMAILIGIVKCNGIFFVQFQKRFGSSASMTSLIHTFHNVGYSLTSLVVMTVGMKYMSSRTSVMLGATVYSCCFLVTALAEDFNILFITLGVINGIAFAFIHPPVIAMIGVYFEKHRGVANSISVVGVSIGGLAFAPFVTFLFEELAYTGAFLIISGILFHLAICGALLRPTEFYTTSKRSVLKRRMEEIYDIEEQLLLTGNTSANELFSSDSITGENFKNEKRLSKIINKPIYKLVTGNLMRAASQDLEKKHHFGEPFLENSSRFRSWSVGNSWRRQNEIPEGENKHSLFGSVVQSFDRSLSAKFASSDVISSSLLDINTPNNVDAKSNYHISAEIEKRKALSFAKFKSWVLDILRLIFDFKLLKNPVFCVFLLCAGLMCVGVALTITFVPPLAKDLNIPGSDIALLLSVNNVVDMIARVVFGIISDRGWIRRSTILGVTALLMGLPSHFVGLIDSYYKLLVYGVILGMFQGVYFALYAVVIVDYLKLENMKTTLGFTVLMQGVFTCAVYPIVGALRDATNSYVSSYHLLGFILNTSALLAFLLPLVEKWNNKRQSRKGFTKQTKSGEP